MSGPRHFIPERIPDPPPPLSEQEAAAIVAGASPSMPDHFAVLNRRGRPLSDEQVVAILMEGPGVQGPSGPRDLPTARRSPAPATPPVALDYRGRGRGRRARAVTAPALAGVPVMLRVLRVGVWLAVAGLVLFLLLTAVLARLTG